MSRTRSWWRTLAALLALSPVLGAGVVAVGPAAQAGAAAQPGSTPTLSGDVPVVGDWDGNGTATVGIRRQGTFHLRNTNDAGFADAAFTYGNPGDVPLVGDWDGNGTVTPGVWRNGVFYLRNTNSTGVADVSFVYGNPDDVPLVGDWDGNGTVTPGVWRNGAFFLRNSNATGNADAAFVYGDPTDVPVTGDWDANGTATVGVRRGIVFHLRNTNSTGIADESAVYGDAGDVPVAGDWNGDGRDTIGVRRGSIFYLRNANTSGIADLTVPFGDATLVGPGGGGGGGGGGVPNLAVSSVLGGLNRPWDLAFAPDGTMLVTEKFGRISVRLADGTTRPLVADLADLLVAGETGLMSIEADPGFATNRRLYTCQGDANGPAVQVVSWVADAGWTRLDRVADPLLGALPIGSGRHGGCRLRFGPDGALFVGTGDAASSDNPQNPASFGGKVLRIDANTGGEVAGNPFIGSPGVDPRIWTLGHRNVQGLAIRPGSGQLWEVEHGPDRDDEINLSQPGGNYGWAPGPGYDESVPMTFAGGVAAKWSSGAPPVAPSGATFLSGSAWGAWEGALAVAQLRGAALEVHQLQGDAIVASTKPAALNGTFGRLRTPRLGPDGAIYVTTDNAGNGGVDQVLRIAPS